MHPQRLKCVIPGQQSFPKCTHLIASLKSVRIFVFNKPWQTNPSGITTYANFAFLVYIAFTSSLYDSFPLFLKRSIALLVRQSSLPSPPSLVFQNSLHRQFIHIKYVVSRWSNGNRGRATSVREVIEVAGSNHAIGVILNLAWGPNNFSPSMIWIWRTRSNSRTGLGAE